MLLKYVRGVEELKIFSKFSTVICKVEYLPLTAYFHGEKSRQKLMMAVYVFFMLSHYSIWQKNHNWLKKVKHVKYITMPHGEIGLSKLEKLIAKVY